jgi:rhodanese-related sulfurtransferase
MRERPTAVICRTKRMSIQAVELLLRAGFRRVQLVADGMLAWRRQDHA